MPSIDEPLDSDPSGASRQAGPRGLVDVVGPLWSQEKVILELGVNLSAIASGRAEGHLLGLETADGDVGYPVWQFRHRDGRVEARPALTAVLFALRRHDPWTVAVLLCTPAPELMGMTPLDWERAGKSDETLRLLGQAVAREWAAGGA